MICCLVGAKHKILKLLMSFTQIDLGIQQWKSNCGKSYIRYYPKSGNRLSFLRSCRLPFRGNALISNVMIGLQFPLFFFFIFFFFYFYTLLRFGINKSVLLNSSGNHSKFIRISFIVVILFLTNKQNCPLDSGQYSAFYRLNIFHAVKPHNFRSSDNSLRWGSDSKQDYVYIILSWQ